MSTPEKSYSVVSQVHINQWVDELQQVVPGWRIMARSTATGVIVPVFVPNADYTPDKVSALLDAAVRNADAIHALGG